MSDNGLKDSVTAEECVYITGNLRLSVLSERILRVERSEGAFCDAPTQTVFHRDFAKPQFEVTENDNKVVVTTNPRFSKWTSARSKSGA